MADRTLRTYLDFTNDEIAKLVKKKTVLENILSLPFPECQIQALHYNWQSRYPLTAVGKWKVMSQETDRAQSTCLGFFEGTFHDAIAWALQQPSYSYNGGGGEIIKIL
jgi:hypothetical protein